MSKIITIAITILRHKGCYLFLKRRNAPYENLWSLVGGKVNLGEHLSFAAVREIKEETGAKHVEDYRLQSIISERLVDPKGELEAHFIIFLGSATISNFSEEHREGDLETFTKQGIVDNSDDFLPSDLEMFLRFVDNTHHCIAYHEAELLRNGSEYRLQYYREGHI